MLQYLGKDITILGLMKHLPMLKNPSRLVC